MEVKGKIKAIFETREVGEKSFKTRDLVVTTDEQYPQHILIQCVQDKCDILNQFKVGDNVEVDINLRGREWVNPQGETKYFNTLQAWKVTLLSATNITPKDALGMPVQFEMVEPSGSNQHDDLPF